MKKFPNTNLGWYDYYMKRYKETGNQVCSDIAQMYLLFHLAFGNEKIPA